MTCPEDTNPTDSPQPDDNVINQRISVPFEYPVHFARDVFAPDNELLAAVLDRLGERRRHRAAVLVDAGLAEAQPGLVGAINEYFHTHPAAMELAAPPQLVPGGEQAKTSWEPVRQLMWTVGNLHLDRQSYVIVVGGGSVLDMAGFAASIVHRGLRMVRIPSTTLAQNDAGIGVKNGMDEHGQKNFVGTFAPPFAVLNDFALLDTLSERDWIGGAAEAFKVAIIKDAEFFDFLCGTAADLRDRDASAMEHLIRRCAELHLEHIRTSGDPFEFGSARPLDFGHWAGHKLEVMSDYAMGHGQAAAVGMSIDSFCAMRQGLLSPEQFERIVTGLLTCGLPIWCRGLEQRTAEGELEVLDGLNQFREHLGGVLTVTLPDGIGRKVEVHHVSADCVAEAVDALQEIAGRAQIR